MREGMPAEVIETLIGWDDILDSSLHPTDERMRLLRGTYTVCFYGENIPVSDRTPSKCEDWVRVRVRKMPDDSNFCPGSVVADYWDPARLRGKGEYVTFGFADERSGNIRLWKSRYSSRVRTNTMVIPIADVILKLAASPRNALIATAVTRRVCGVCKEPSMDGKCSNGCIDKIKD